MIEAVSFTLNGKAVRAEADGDGLLRRPAGRDGGSRPGPAPRSFKVMGTPALHRDAKDKVTGRAQYAGDIRLPGMLYARVLRPPAHGAMLKALDVAGAEKIAGAKVVRDGR